MLPNVNFKNKIVDFVITFYPILFRGKKIGNSDFICIFYLIIN